MDENHEVHLEEKTHSKFPISLAIALILIIMLIGASVYYLILQKNNASPAEKTPQQPAAVISAPVTSVSPSTPTPTIPYKEEYQNPFKQNTNKDYKNPFE